MNRRDGKVLPAFWTAVCLPAPATLPGSGFHAAGRLFSAACFLLLRALVLGYSCA